MSYYPRGWAMPFMANAVFLHEPLEKVLVIRLTVVGRHIDIAIPRQVRKRMTCMLDLARPRAMVKATNRKLPTIQSVFGPTISPIAPNT